MLKSVIQNRSLVPLAMALAAAAGLATGTPAQAGPLKFLKKIAKEQLMTELQDADTSGSNRGDVVVVRELDKSSSTQAQSQPHARVIDGTRVAHAGINVAAGDVNGDGVADIVTGASPGHANTTPKLPEFRREKGTAVHTADDVQMPGTTQASSEPKLPEHRREKGTRVGTADNIQAQGTQQASTEPKLPEFRREKGTAVHTADDVQAPGQQQAALLLPAVQKVREAAGK